MLNSVKLGVIVTEKRLMPKRSRDDKPSTQITVSGIGFSTRLYIAQGHPHLQLAQLGVPLVIEGSFGSEGRIGVKELRQDTSGELINEVKLRAVVFDTRRYEPFQDGDPANISVTLAGLGFTTRISVPEPQALQLGIKIGVQIDLDARMGEEGKLIPDNIKIDPKPDPVWKQVLAAVQAKNKPKPEPAKQPA